MAERQDLNIATEASVLKTVPAPVPPVAADLANGDRLLLLMDRTLDWQVAMTACLHFGAVPVPCVTQVTGDDVAHRVERSGAAAAVRDRASVREDVRDGIVSKAAAERLYGVREEML